MYTIFSTRELATAFWIIILIIISFIYPKTRKALSGVLKAAIKPKLTIPLFLMIIYAILFIFLLSHLVFWKWLYVKDISIWVLFAGIPTCYKTIGKKINEHYFHDMVFDNFKFTVLVEFIIGTFTFSFFCELIIIFMTGISALIYSVAATKKEYSSIKILTKVLLFFAALAVIIFSFKEAIDSYQTLGIIDLLVSFCTPFIFSVLYIPVVYLYAIYTTYETLFMRMSFKEPKDKKIKCQHRIAVVKACGLSYKKITTFEQYYIENIYIPIKQPEFDSLIKKFRTNIR